MLPSAGFFAKVDCPFFIQGFCERPFCHYNHAKDEIICLRKSPISKPGPGQGHLALGKGALRKPAVALDKDPCLSELERLNREIETVKFEVEKEQRRLSRYQTLQGDDDDDGGGGSSKVSVPLNVTKGKDSNANNLRLAHTQSAVPFAPRSKYVVDSSRPRTDLEYDPLSNYSADLRPSGVPECKALACGPQEENLSLKRKREMISEDLTEWSPEVDDSDEEGVLVIDIPPLEDDRQPSLRETPTDELLGSSDCRTPPPAIPDSSASGQQCEPEASACASVVRTPGDSDFAEAASGVNQRNDHKITIPNAFEDLSKCLENLRSESERIASLKEVEVEPLPGCASECSGIDSVGLHSKDLMANPVGLVEVSTQSVPFGKDYGLLPKPPSTGPSVSLSLRDNCPFTVSASLGTKPQDPCQDKRADADENCWSSVPQKSLPLQKPSSALNLAGACRSTSEGRDQSHQPASTATLPQVPQASSTSEEPPPVPGEPTLSSAAHHPVGLQEICDLTGETDVSSEDDVDYSGLVLSDSDPMEECYRIFMEANPPGPEPAASSESPVTAVDVEKQGVKKPVSGTGVKKRVAHVSKHEVPRSRQQVLIPFRGAVPGLIPNPPRLQQLQQRASVLTAAVKGGQAFVAATSEHKRLEVGTPALAPAPAPAQTACVNILPVGAAIQWANVHFILPEGSIALPIAHVPPPVAVPQAALTPAKVERLGAVSSQPIAIKRKPKMRRETSTKVPHDIRQRYVNLFVEEFLKTSFTVQDAFEKALAEEKIVHDRSVNKLKYLSVAVNALKKLKNQNAPPVKACTETSVLGSKGNVELNPLVLQANGPGTSALYDHLKEHVLSEALLKENNYPLAHPERPGLAVQHKDVKKGSADSLKRICCRCGATYSVTTSGNHVRKEECNYHYGKVVENKVPGGVETRYTCCEGAIGTPGCQVFKLHVHDAVSLEGFVSSAPKPVPEKGTPGVFALNCETCFTTQGLELARVTVVNPSLQVIYDAFVKPENEVIDFNTRFSGISEEDLSRARSSIRDVQAVLLSFISSDTILIGHGLENDLCALRFLHGSVVDTAVVFPHRLGLPHKRELRSLVADYLRRIIQESADGHDSGEDATACMELMLWKVKEDSKVKRW